MNIFVKLVLIYFSSVSCIFSGFFAMFLCDMWKITWILNGRHLLSDNPYMIIKNKKTIAKILSSLI